MNMDYCEMAMEIRRLEKLRAEREARRDRRIGKVYAARGARVERYTGRWPEPVPTNRQRVSAWAAKFYLQEPI